MGRRNKKYVVPQVTFTGIGNKGKSVGRDEEGRVIFVEDVAPGDVADVLITRRKKGYLLGVVQEFHKYSEDRVEPVCAHFGVCGGCKWQHISYEAQVKHKQTIVENAMQRIGKVEIQEFLPILPSAETTYYRNKLEFSYSNKRWLSKEELDTDISNLEDVLGFHKAGAFDKIVNIEHCWLQGSISNDLRNFMRDLGKKQELSFYDARENKGFLRNFVIRVTSLNEILLIVVVKSDDQKKINPYLDAIKAQFPQITALYYCVNPKVNDFILDLEMVNYHGKEAIEEALGHVRFKIGPKSFFQTNSKQAKLLYDVVKDFANLQGDENVYDLYTGIGSIALYLAKDCKQVVGIEEIEAAIDDAKENAQLNKIENAVFYAGDVKNILTADFAETHGRPDVLITDPPRAGMHPKVVAMLLELKAPKIVYVSCNPATQARDLEILDEHYEVLKMRPVDMFPHTHHIENVALLQLRDS